MHAKGNPGMQEDELYKKLLIPTGISLFAGLARFAFSEKKSFVRFLRGVIIAGFVGLMTASGIENLVLPEGVKGVIIGVTSFCADEVAIFLIAAAGELKKDPLGYLSRVITSLRGQK